MKLPPELRSRRKAIGEVYARNLGVDSVFLATSTIKEEFRQPSLERIYGDSNEVVNMENGIRYCFDITRLMFSKGNTPERARVCRMDMSGEKVLDMFAGIGYFTLPAAVHGKAQRVLAVEKNPVSHHYLQKNVKLNGCEKVVSTVLGDNREIEPGRDFDRVFMGYLIRTGDHVHQALRAISEKGGILHFHSNIERTAYRRLRGEEKITPGHLDPELGAVLSRYSDEHKLWLDTVRLVKVKSDAPSVYHVVFDLDFKKT